MHSTRRQELTSGVDDLVFSTRDLLLMPDDGTQGDWRIARFQEDLKSSREDLKDMRDDMRTGFREVNISISNVQSSLQGLMVSMPLTYVTRVDLAEKLATAEDSSKNRADAAQKQIAELQATIRQLIFAIIGALLSGGLALLIEVLKLLGGSK